MAENKLIDMSKAHALIMDSFITAFEMVLEQIEEQCTIEPESLRPTALWEYVPEEDAWRCSNCHTVADTDGRWDRPMKKFCEECGAKMEGWK